MTKFPLCLLDILLLWFSTAAGLDNLTMTIMQKSTINNFTIEYKTTPLNPTGITKCHLIGSIDDGGSGKVLDIYATNCDVDIATFEESLDALDGLNMSFLLQGLDTLDNPLITGEATVMDFPELPSTFKGQLATVTNWRQDGITSGDTLLRLTGLTPFLETDIEPLPGGTTVPPANDVHYFLNPTGGNEYAACSGSSGTDLKVCDTQQTMTPVDIINGGLTIDTATLTYESMSTSNPAVIMNVTSEGSTSTQLEAVISFGAAATRLEQSSIGEVSFSVDGYTVGGSITLDIIGLDGTDNMLQYGTLTITDYDVQGLGISATSLEVRWNYQDSVSAYHIERTTNAEDSGYQTASVTCNLGGDVNINHCFGYFPGLKGGDYKVTVKKNSGTTDDDLNMVQSKGIPVPDSVRKGLSIHHQLDWQSNGMEAEIRVCFNHTRNNAEKHFSHYEFVIINNKDGKWFKQKLMIQETEGELCFSPQTINVNMFHREQGATLVVTQRAEDGFRVVASGEIQLFLN